MKAQRPPFVIGVLANFSGQTAHLPKLKHRRFVTVTRDSFAGFLRHTQPRIALSVPAAAEGVAPSPSSLTFHHIDDFIPRNLAANVAEQGIARDEAATSIAGQLLSDATYQDLRATWTGLWYLLDCSVANPRVSIKVLDVSRKDLLKDLQRAPHMDQSALFLKVYLESAGTFGGEPFGCLLGDYYMSDHPADIDFIEKISHVIAVVRAPFLHALQPGMEAANLPPTWERICQSQEGSAIFPLLPRFTVRKALPADLFDGVWMNPAYLVGSAVARAWQDVDLLELARSAFPESAAPAPAAPPPTAEMPAPEIGFEYDGAANLQRSFADVGVNALTGPDLEKSDFLRTLSCAARASGGSALSYALARCRLLNLINDRLRYESP